jgi:phage shock protein C
MKKRLVKKDKKIFGVCGGLGEYLDIDPTIIRIIFLVSALIFGSGVLLYIIMAIIMPDEKPVA